MVESDFGSNCGNWENESEDCSDAIVEIGKVISEAIEGNWEVILKLRTGKLGK
ncbi:hypothetical protein TSUD_294200 [Trifolium subterraneum]|uniref:Uncharacterized protein n=1 Tax=Trifolium subterraneum TaxID=3900 RepID=A0A2Z6M1U0_TRISU|nr:hypothetical protein TSUD_294200 [Trifolium subterraneum]